MIIGILSAIALPQYTTAVEKARAAEAVTLMGTIRYAGERYRLQTGSFPNTDMTVLDIEVPTSKNFDITASGTDTYVISAKRNSGTTYYLGTIVSADGTATRCCGSTVTANGCTAAAANSDALRICSAITSGHNTDGKW